MRVNTSYYYSTLFITSILLLSSVSKNVFSDPVQDEQNKNDNLSFCQAKDIAAAHHNKPKMFSAEEIDNTERECGGSDST